MIAFDPRDAEACFCSIQTREEAFAGSTAVFLGTAREIAQAPIPTTFGPLLEIEFDVSRVWKGDVTRTQACHLNRRKRLWIRFPDGSLLLVYVTRNDCGLWASLCSQTRATDQGADQLGLGPGSAPLDNPVVAASDAPGSCARRGRGTRSCASCTDIESSRHGMPRGRLRTGGWCR